ncbi:MAG: 2-octaprenyl-6-methoxyphenyl hydroxylase [Chromatiales bacterium]|nr:2-octaprenyl-6-methoxyphenyl hydroxylase [Chromatiales bacterium]
MTAAPSYDVVIAGGGLVGASLAVALAGSPLRIALVEALAPGMVTRPGFDSRTLALSRSSFRILETLGIWSGLADVAATIRRIHVSEQGRFGTAVISATQQGVPALGHVLESRAVATLLWERLATQDNCTVLAPASVVGSSEEDGARALQLAGDGVPGRIDARLLVVADGARSGLRTSLGIDAVSRRYPHSAIVGNLAVSEPGAGETAFERFTPSGPLAILPAGGSRHAFVLTRSDPEAALAQDDAAFLAALQAQFGYRLGVLEQLGQRSVFPLELVVANRLTAPRAVLVGNAAHALHPVAGQGYNLSLRDIAALAELLVDDQGQDPGSPALLVSYARWREPDQRKVVAFTDGLIRMFGAGWPGLSRARGAALLGFDLVPPAKRLLARHTLGLAGRMSRLVRGVPL